MIITAFEADGFRNLAGLGVRPHPVLNFVVGPNGAGKSSLLEAVQCLATGVGFRSRRFRDHLAHGADEYVLRADLAEGVGGATHRCGVRRGRDGTLDARLDFEPVSSFAEIARVMPVKVMTPDSHLLIQGAPDERRRFLDWGCFHRDEAFLPAWRRYRRALSQRNELLREGAPEREVGAWNEALARDGVRLQEIRSGYISDLALHVKKRTQGVDFPFHVKLELRSGWQKGSPLDETLARNLELHRRMRTTTDGPHRAEIAVRVDDHAARDVLSRGQQKLLVYLMHLAQLDALIGEGTAVRDRIRPVVLCDDLGSELDDGAGAALLDALVASGSQVFVSGTSMPALPSGMAPSETPDAGPVSEADSNTGPGTDPSTDPGTDSGTDSGTRPPPAGLVATPTDTTLEGTETSDPSRPFAVLRLDAGRLRD